MVAFTKTSTTAEDKLQNIKEAMLRTVNEGFRATKSSVFRGLKSTGTAVGSSSSGAGKTLQAMETAGQDTTTLQMEDIRIFGDLWWGARFNSQYGATVVDGLESLIDSVVHAEGGEWKAVTPIKQGEYLERIWDCVLSSEFYTYFLNMVEYNTQRELSGKVEKLQRLLAGAMLDLYERHEKELATQLDKLKKENRYATQPKLEEAIRMAFCADFRPIDEKFTEDLKALLEHKSYAKWKEGIQLSWAQEAQQARKNKEQLLEAAVDSRLGFEATLAAVKARIEREIVRHKDKIITLKAEQQEVLFNKLFKDGLEEHELRRPPKAHAVAGLVMAVYPRLCDLVIDKKDIETLVQEARQQLCWKKFIDSRMSKYTDSIKDLWEEVRRSAELGNGVYSEQKIWDLAKQVSRMLYRKRQRQRVVVKDVHTHACVLLIFEMEEGQTKWDRKNNTTVMSMKDDLKDYFTLIAKGVSGMELLKERLVKTLNKSGEKALLQVASHDGAKDVLQRDFAYNSALMACLLERDLVAKVVAHQRSSDLSDRRRALKDLLHAVSRPRDHYEDLLVKNITQVLDGGWKLSCVSNFKEMVRCAISAASLQGRRAQDASIKVGVFLRALAERWPAGLSGPVRAMMEDADSAFKDKVEGMKLEDFPDLMRPEMEVWEQGLALDSKEVAKSVLQQLRIQQVGMVFQERCTEKCPRCSMLCNKARGHDEAEGDNRRHNAVHQPGGLQGVFWAESNTYAGELVHTSCLQAVEENHSIVVGDEHVPYRQFGIRYPNWHVPNIAERSLIREYIFYHFHHDIAQAYQKKPCTAPMEEYAHDLEHLTNKLDRQIEAYTK